MTKNTLVAAILAFGLIFSGASSSAAEQKMTKTLSFYNVSLYMWAKQDRDKQKRDDGDLSDWNDVRIKKAVTSAIPAGQCFHFQVTGYGGNGVPEGHWPMDLVTSTALSPEGIKVIESSLCKMAKLSGYGSCEAKVSEKHANTRVEDLYIGYGFWTYTSWNSSSYKFKATRFSALGINAVSLLDDTCTSGTDAYPTEYFQSLTGFAGMAGRDIRAARISVDEIAQETFVSIPVEAKKAE